MDYKITLKGLVTGSGTGDLLTQGEERSGGMFPVLVRSSIDETKYQAEVIEKERTVQQRSMEKALSQSERGRS